MRKVVAAAAIVLALAAAPVVAAPAPTSQYQSWAHIHCDTVDAAPADDNDQSGADYIIDRCKGLGGVQVWVVMHEGVRMSIGVGSQANAAGQYSPDRSGTRKLEWRGTIVGGLFRPFAVILRLDNPYWGHDDIARDNRLVVYGLTRDGRESCVLGEARGADQAQKARVIADAAAIRRCDGTRLSEDLGEINGASDGTRTRDLRRDRPAL
jgi:hypothetical protein